MKEVHVYTQPDCPPCQIVKQYLDHHGIDFTVFNVAEDAEARNRMTGQLKSFSTPTVTVDGETVAGFDLKKLGKLLGLAE